MIQQTTSHTTLESRREVSEGVWSTWSRADAGMWRSAYILARQGRLIEAIERAQEIAFEQYNGLHGFQFRCITVSRTVSVMDDLGEQWSGE